MDAQAAARAVLKNIGGKGNVVQNDLCMTRLRLRVANPTLIDRDALIGTKGTWYDHKVSVRNPQPLVEDTASDAETEVPKDGTYTCNVTLEGGSGRATIESPTELTVADGKMTAEITWSSPNYDYMIVDGEKYLPVNTEGNSVFEIPVAALDTALAVTADTTAMSTPHEIEYTLTFDSASLTA